MKTAETYEKNRIQSSDYNIDEVSTAMERFYKEIAKSCNIQKVSEALEKLGVKIRSEDGNYRSTYDVLNDLSNHWK